MVVMGIYHSPLSVRFPFIRILSFLIIFTSYFEKIAMQSSSQSWPMEIKVPLFKLEKLYAILAFLENSVGKESSAFFVGMMIRPSATVTHGPLVCVISLHVCSASSVM